jgi:PAS domain S-box-containing protein
MKRFRTTYIVALVIVAIFVILAEIAVQLGFTASEEDARLINIASRQRALVQKIAKSSVILSQTTNVDTFQIYKKELAESLDLWQKSHQALLKGDLVIGIKSPKNSPATIQRFQDLQPFYEQIQTAAMAIAANDYSLVISDETKKLEIKNNTGIILENEAKYFPIMNEIVDQYEKEAKGRTDTTALIAWSVGIIILGVLVLLAIFYFAPISKKLENFVEEIENKNKKLAASEMELRKISEEQLKLNEDLFIAQKQAQEQNEKLKQAEEETRKALEHQERTNQKLLVAQRELQKTLIEQNRINQQLIAAQEEAEKKRKELEKNEQEMRMLAEAQLEANEKLLLAQKQEEKVRQELAITAQKQEALNRILQKSILTNSSNFNEFLEHSIDVLSEIKFLELLPGVGIFLKKEGESEVYEMVRQKNISPKIQELCHNIKTGQCLCGLAIKTKETQYAHCVDERHTTRFEGIKEHGHYNIPILYQEEALGAVVVYLPHGHKREQAEINFLEAVANIIASTYIKVKNEKELQATLEKVARSEQEMRLLAEAQLEANEKLLLAQREAEKSKKELEETLEQQKVITSSLALAQKEISRRAEELEKAEREMRQLAEAQIEANEKLILAQKIEKERTAKIEKHNAILTNLSTTPFEKYENLEKALQAITEAVAEGLGIERASIWDYTGTSLVSKDLFEKTKNQHSAGLELFAKDFPAYFEGVQSGLAIVAHNAHTHPNTFEFSEVYLKPLGINSMLDVPIRVAGELKGVVCCEYVGTDFKEWTLEDENFARSISEIISLMIEADKRKKAEKELQIAFESLKKSQKEIERLALVASKTDNAIIITDANGFIEWANEGFERLTEYKLEEVKGKKPGSFLQGEKTNPADVFAIRQGIASLKSFYQEIYNYSKSGRGYWLGINITPLFDEQNNLTGFIAIESDITERKQAEIELQNALEKARRAEEDMRALAEAQLEANERLMMAEKQLKETLELEKKQKEELDRLVAQLKETQGQLVHNEKMASLGQLTAGIAHEINNPINFVYNGIDTLKISLDDLMEIVKKYNELDSANGNKEEIIQQAKELKEQLGFEELTQDIEHLVADIKKGAIRTMEIVKGLRIFSRLDEEERKMANIKEALESTLILLNNKMKGRIEVKKYYDETMPEILCYPGQLNQVFMNILNNAIQAIPEDRKDGEITIYTENQAENVIIRIKDNGVGMSEQVKRRIFEPFFTTKPVGVGTGLGLSITFGIIEKHGGQIFVNSEEGKGTEFVIQLPKERI